MKTILLLLPFLCMCSGKKESKQMIGTNNYDVWLADKSGVVACRNDSGWTVYNAKAALEILYKLYLNDKK